VLFELASAIRGKRVTGEEATAAYLRRDLDLNAKYNAIVTYNVRAMDRARLADLALASGKTSKCKGRRPEPTARSWSCRPTT
jgi:Asp-tRNA(Asn)/Glu-tRNA(Gln) amidotransferase A subunit family amidase